MSGTSPRNIENAATKAFRQLATTADEFERYQNSHAGRIARISDELAKSFQMAPQDRKSLHGAALLHDLGELVMERDYINRAGSLSDEERVDLSRHSVIGEQESARVGADRAVQLLVRWHHEWWNGGGYPDALKRSEIPLAARILRVVDSYAALTDARPYRPALTEAEAREKVSAGAGIEFDPKVVAAFLTLPSMEELHSFAMPEQVFTTEEEPRSLFSSFMK